MTSKQALNNIRDYNAELIHDVGIEYSENPLEEECNIIEKDLEKLEQYEAILNTPLEEIRKRLKVLEILKNYLYYDEKTHFIKMKPISKSTHNFDYETLKEWLDG